MRISLYDSDSCRILVPWIDLWNLNECIRVQLLVSDADELDDIRRVYGIRHCESAAWFFQSIAGTASDTHGQCPAHILWDIDAGQVQRDGVEEVLPDLRNVR